MAGMTPALALFLLTLSGAQAAQAPAPLGYDEQLRLYTGDEACSLLNAPERALLGAAIKRSRDAAALAGYSERRVSRHEDAVLGQFQPECADPDLNHLARRHIANAAAMASVSHLTLPGRRQDWMSVRGRQGAGPVWRIAQFTNDGEARFGLYELDGEPQAGLAFRTDAPPAGAILIFRNTSRLAEPADLTAGGLLNPPGGDPVGAWGAPAGAEKRIPASARMDPDLAGALTPAGGGGAVGFVFPVETVRQLSALEPREGARIELFDARGRTIATYWIEIGGLDAAMTLQTLPLRAPTAGIAARASAL